MANHFWVSRAFWGPTLKYIGLVVTAVFGIIGTVWETHEERQRKNGVGTEKSLTAAGRALLIGIVLSMFVGTFGVVIEERQKSDEARQAEAERKAARDQASQQLSQLDAITNTTKASADTLGGLVNSSKEALIKIGAVGTELQRERYKISTLTATFVWTMPDTDPTLNAIRSTAFMKVGTDPLNPADTQAVKFFRDLHKDFAVDIAVRAGSEKYASVAATATTNSPEGRCKNGEHLNCISIAHPYGKKIIELWITMPLRFSTARMATLHDFGGTTIEGRFAFYSIDIHPTFQHIEEVVFHDEASMLSLRVSNSVSSPPNRYYNTAFRVTLPNDVGPGKGSGVRWR